MVQSSKESSGKADVQGRGCGSVQGANGITADEGNKTAALIFGKYYMHWMGIHDTNYDAFIKY